MNIYHLLEKRGKGYRRRSSHRASGPARVASRMSTRMGKGKTMLILNPNTGFVHKFTSDPRRQKNRTVTLGGRRIQFKRKGGAIKKGTAKYVSIY